ncbi:glycine-rich protein, partial [Striga asiatica]
MVSRPTSTSPIASTYRPRPNPVGLVAAEATVSRPSCATPVLTVTISMSCGVVDEDDEEERRRDEHWLKRNEDERPGPGGSFDSLREKRGMGGGKETSQSVGGGQPKLNLHPITLPVGKVQKEEVAGM